MCHSYNGTTFIMYINSKDDEDNDVLSIGDARLFFRRLYVKVHSFVI